MARRTSTRARRALLLALLTTALAACAVTTPRDGGTLQQSSSGLTAPSEAEQLSGVVGTDPGTTTTGAEGTGSTGGVATGPGGAGSPGSTGTSGGSSGTGPATSTGSGTTGGAGSGGTGTRTAPGVNPGQPGQGVSEKKVKVGFIVLRNTQQQAQNNGFTAANSGDGEKVVNALLAMVNAKGGFGGRQVEPVFRFADINTASSQTEQATCAGFVQDDKVFAVVPVALIYEDSRACYAKGRTLLIDTAGFPYDQTTYDNLAPYYWSPGFADYGSTVKSLVAQLAKTDYFKGAKVGIVAYSNPSYRRVVDRDFKPALKAAGISQVQVEYIEQTSLASTQSGTNSAVVSLSTNGVNRVMFLGASTLSTFFMNRAESQQYRPRYGITTWEAPQFLQLQTKSSSGFVREEQIDDAIGIGFVPALDADSKKNPWPDADEKPCLDALKAKGITFNTHYDAARALNYCSSILLLKAASDKAGSVLNASTWASAAGRLGTSFQSPSGVFDDVRPGRQATAAAYRPLAWDKTCRCFTYTGPRVPLID